MEELSVKIGEMNEILKKYDFTALGKVHKSPNISEKIYQKLFKKFDQNLNVNYVVSFYDTTLSHNCGNGMIVTLTGFYVYELLEKPFYINYKDIDRMDIIPNKKGDYNATDSALEIVFFNGETKKISSGDYYKTSLKNVIIELKDKFMSWDDVICFKSTGEVGKLQLTSEEKKKCNAIIHTAAVSCGGVGTGLAQIPLADNAVIAPIQVTMVISLGNEFGIRVTEGAAKGIIGGAAASFIGRSVAQILWGWIPGIGNAINTATAAGLTEAIGWMAVAHFYDMREEDKAKYKLDGMKNGYNAASAEYEIKLRKQAEAFLNQKKDLEREKEEYNKLLDDYKAYIEELEQEKAEVEIINEFKSTLEELKSLVN